MVKSTNALAVASIDGLATVECGIASVVHWFFEEFDRIAATSAGLRDNDWSLYALAPRIDERSSDFSPAVNRIVSDACGRHGGSFRWFDVEDTSSLKTVWSLDKPERWETMCAGLAVEVKRLCTEHARVTLVVHGVMLTALREYLSEEDNLQIVFVAHSLGRVFDDKASNNRSKFEDRGFAAMEKFPQVRVAYIGSYFRSILLDRYHLSPDKLVPMINAIPESSFRFPKVDREEANRYLASRGIPLNKRLYFSWGRCTGQKGFDALIPGFRTFLKTSPDAHLVLLMPQEVSPQDYIDLLDRELSSIPEERVTVIREFDPFIPYFLLQHPALFATVFASRFEGAPLAVLETLRFGRSDLKILWNDIPPMAQFLDGVENAIVMKSLSEEHINCALREAESSPRLERQNQGGSYPDNISEGLTEALTWWTAPSLA